MKENTKNKVLPLILSAVVVLLDQITKALVVKHIPRLSVWADDAVIEILGKYIRLIHVRNNAIAFSMGHTLSQNARGILFATISNRFHILHKAALIILIKNTEMVIFYYNLYIFYF